MIENLRNVNYNFLTLLLGASSLGEESFASTNSIPIYNIDNTLLFNCNFFYQRASGENFSQVREERYPLIALYDFLPEPDEFDNNWGLNYRVGGYNTQEIDTVNGENPSLQILPRPIRLNQRFQLSLFAKKPSQMFDMIGHVYRNFPTGLGQVVWFNKKTYPSGNFTGDPVNIIIKEIETQNRNEGLIEQLFYIDISYWISLKPSVTVDIYSKLKTEYIISGQNSNNNGESSSKSIF